MTEELETLIERREVVDRTKQVVFGHRKKSSLLSGETDQIGDFIDRMN